MLKMVYHGRSIREVTQFLGIGENLIYMWKSRSIQTASQTKEGKGVNFTQVEALNRPIRELERPGPVHLSHKIPVLLPRMVRIKNKESSNAIKYGGRMRWGRF
jgi:hypothetical protein